MGRAAELCCRTVYKKSPRLATALADYHAGAFPKPCISLRVNMKNLASNSQWAPLASLHLLRLPALGGKTPEGAGACCQDQKAGSRGHNL